MDILTFLGLEYRVTSLIILYFVVRGISIQKINRIIRSYKNLFKHVENGRTDILVTII